MNMKDCIKKGLLTPHSFTEETIHKEMENARHHLENSERSYEYGMMDLSIISSYTAMFHAARSLLLAGFKERSHVCIAAFLREEHPELREYSDLFDIYRKNRHESLYGTDYAPLYDDARSGIDYAKMFIDAVDEILNDPSDDE